MSINFKVHDADKLGVSVSACTVVLRGDCGWEHQATRKHAETTAALNAHRRETGHGPFKYVLELAEGHGK